MAGSERPKVGEILLRAGIIDRHQLQAALGEQRRWGRRLGSTLIKMGFVDERALVRALASQLDLPVATLEGKRIHPDVLGLIPGAVAEKHMVIPLFVKKEGGANRLFVGMEDPGSLDVLDELRFRSGMDVRAVMVGPSELAEAIDRYYRRDAAAESPAGAPLDDTNPIVESASEPTPAPEPTAAVQPEPQGVPSGTEELARFFTLPDESETELEDLEEVDAGETTLPDASEAVLDLESPADPLPAPLSPAAPEPAPAPIPMPGAVAAPTPMPGQGEPHGAPAAAAPTPSPEPAPAFAPSAPPVEPVRETPPDRPRIESAPDEAAPPAAPTADARLWLGLQAVTSLLIEKGVLTREEIQQRMREIQQAAAPED